jgi:hypothetical protein
LNLGGVDPPAQGLAGGAVRGHIVWHEHIMAVAASLTIFATVGGIDLERFSAAASVTVIIGFVLPFWYAKDKENRHIKAVTKEYPDLREERDGRGH